MSDIIQGSPEWFAIRCGKVTASKMADIVAKTKSGWGASRANYLAQLVCERLTGQVAESYSNAAMAWGTENEPSARSAYCFLNDVEVAEIGFVDHPTIPMSGASPDGLIGDDGLIEIKCPNTATHIEFLLTGNIPEKYRLQMLWQMACTGRQWNDYASFDPRLPADLQLKVVRLLRDDAAIRSLETEVAVFLSELDGKLAAIQKLRDAA